LREAWQAGQHALAVAVLHLQRIEQAQGFQGHFGGDAGAGDDVRQVAVAKAKLAAISL
jgi:hypothetical protein